MLRKSLKNYTEFTFVTAQNKSHDPQEDGQRWFSTKKKLYDSHDTAACSLKVVTDSLKNEGPFDGVIAFGQETSLLAIDDEGERRRQQFQLFHLRVQLQEQTVHVPEDKITMSTLHVMGETDKVIEKEMSVKLSELCKNEKVLEYKRDHFLPLTLAEKPH